VIGRRDRLSARLRREIGHVERATEAGRKLDLRIAVDYSSRESIIRAAMKCDLASAAARERFVGLIAASNEGAAAPEPASAAEVDLSFAPVVNGGPPTSCSGSRRMPN
jgi:hypothetical protein